MDLQRVQEKSEKTSDLPKQKVDFEKLDQLATTVKRFDDLEKKWLERQEQTQGA